METTIFGFLLVLTSHGLHHRIKFTDFSSFFSNFFFIKEIKNGSTFLIVDLLTRNFKIQSTVLLLEFILSFF